jgi:hypothetical protein
LPQTDAEVIAHWSKIGYLQGLGRLEQRVNAEINELALQLEELKQPNNENPTTDTV